MEPSPGTVSCRSANFFLFLVPGLVMRSTKNWDKDAIGGSPLTAGSDPRFYGAENPNAAMDLKSERLSCGAGAEGITGSSSDQRCLILRATVGRGKQQV
ncbi:hypothetical protein BDW72DRAFT_167828 [Aspergillus terricola var. indicus]